MMSFDFPSHQHIQHAMDHDEPVQSFSDRHPVYLYEIDNKDVIVKFVSAEAAKTHQLNTALLQFLDVPMVDCDVMKLSNESRDKFYNKPDHLYKYGHLVVMPFITGSNMLDLTRKNYKFSRAMRDQIVRFIPAMALADYSDLDEENVILQNSMDICLIDAEIGLLTKKNYHSSIKDLAVNYLSLAFGEAKLTPFEEAKKTQIALVQSAAIFRDKINAGLPEPLNRVKNLQEILLKRTEEMSNSKILVPLYT